MAVTLVAAVGCEEHEAPKAAPSANAPTAPKRPTLKCSAFVPKGWTRVASPMPDHIAEFSTMPAGMRAVSTVMLEEHAGEIDDAADAEKRRTEAAWGDRNAFALLDERPLRAGSHSGTLLVYRWRASPTTPAWIYYRALLPFDERVVLALAESAAAADGDGGKRSRDEDAIMALLQSIDCTRR